MVYIIILNWCGALDTLSCLKSLSSLRGVNYKIIICDNGSADGSYQDILDGLKQDDVYKRKNIIELTRKDAEAYRASDQVNHDSLFLIQTGSNLGFAGGNNVGIRFALNQADMQYVWLLNNDTEVTPDALWHMVKRCQSEPSIGICGSRLVYFHDRAHLQGVGGIYNPWCCTTRHLGGNQSSDKIFDDSEVSTNIDYIIGASMLVSKNLLLEIGLLEESYFLYYEELDLCFRAKGKFAISVALDSVVYHKEGASTGGPKNLKADYLSIRNRLLFTSKNNPSYYWPVRISLILVFFNRLVCGRYRSAINVFKIFVKG